jgi:hypothetical protein
VCNVASFAIFSPPIDGNHYFVERHQVKSYVQDVVSFRLIDVSSHKRPPPFPGFSCPACCYLIRYFPFAPWPAALLRPSSAVKGSPPRIEARLCHSAMIDSGRDERPTSGVPVWRARAACVQSDLVRPFSVVRLLRDALRHTDTAPAAPGGIKLAGWSAAQCASCTGMIHCRKPKGASRRMYLRSCQLRTFLAT